MWSTWSELGGAARSAARSAARRGLLDGSLRLAQRLDGSRRGSPDSLYGSRSCSVLARCLGVVGVSSPSDVVLILVIGSSLFACMHLDLLPWRSLLHVVFDSSWSRTLVRMRPEVQTPRSCAAESSAGRRLSPEPMRRAAWGAVCLPAIVMEISEDVYIYIP